jgi:hypothetical protein
VCVHRNFRDETGNEQPVLGQRAPIDIPEERNKGIDWTRRASAVVESIVQLGATFGGAQASLRNPPTSWRDSGSRRWRRRL